MRLVASVLYVALGFIYVALAYPERNPVMATCTINYLPSWQNAPPPVRTCDEDGTVHYSHLKRIADSGVQYLHAVNTTFEPTPAMLLGTAVHAIVLGERPGAPVHVYPGKARSGKAWEEYAAAHEDGDILTAPEWARAEQIAKAVTSDPVARSFLDGAKYEVPLSWDEDGIACSTSGVDIVRPGMWGDLKTTSTTELEALMRHCFKMSYYAQLAFYRRGLNANGHDTSRGAFLGCVETREPYEVVCLEPSEELLALGDRTVTLWLERLKVYRDSASWPGRAQCPVVWTVPAWMQHDADEDEL